MIRVDVVYALIYQESTQKILMVHNKGSGWSLPGGRVEKEETLEQAVIREVKEETNLTVETDGIIAVNESFFKSQHHHTILFTFKVKNIKQAVEKGTLFLGSFFSSKKLRHIE
jgi:8-oxo-dGTP diphosphatase